MAETIITLPDFQYLKSDYEGRPSAGTSSDPIIVGINLFPNSTWYPAMNALATGQSLVWPNSNFYDSSVQGQSYWTLVINNEPSLNNDATHTGPPDKSQVVNTQNFFFSGNSGSSITFKVTQTAGDGSDGDIPYLGLNTLASKALTGKYGDNIIVSYDLKTNFSTGFGLYQFIIFLELSDGQKKNIGFYLGTNTAQEFFLSSGRTFPFDLEWNWRLQGSSYYPGGIFRFIFPSNYNDKRASNVPSVSAVTASGATYNYSFYLDDIIKVVYPEFAVNTTKILGIELSVEQAWVSTPAGTNTTEAIVSNLKAVKITSDTHVPAPPPPPPPPPPTPITVPNSKIYYLIYGSGAVSSTVYSSSINDNVKAYTPTLTGSQANPRVNTPTYNQGVPSPNGGTNIGNNYYSINQSAQSPYQGMVAGFSNSPNFGSSSSGSGRFYYNGVYMDSLPGGPGAWNIHYPDPNGFVAGPSDVPSGVITVTPKDPNWNYEANNQWGNFSNYLHEREYFGLQYLNNSGEFTSQQLNPVDTLPREAVFALLREITGDPNVITVGQDYGANLGGGIRQNSFIGLNNGIDYSADVVRLAQEKGWLDANGKSTLPPDPYQVERQAYFEQMKQNAAGEIERKLSGTQVMLPGETRESLLEQAQRWGLNINTPSADSGGSADNNSPAGSTIGNNTQNNTAFNDNQSAPIPTGTVVTDGSGTNTNLMGWDPSWGGY